MRDFSTSARLAMQDQNSDAPEIVSIRKVRRKLFHDEGTPGNSGNTDNAANLVIEENKRDLEKAKERWNFDFIEGKPLEGRYQWKKLDKDGNEVEESKPEVEESKPEEEEEESKAEKSDV